MRKTVSDNIHMLMKEGEVTKVLQLDERTDQKSIWRPFHPRFDISYCRYQDL